MEVDELRDARHAHHGDGLVHAAGLGAHIALACARELRHFLLAIREPLSQLFDEYMMTCS